MVTKNEKKPGSHHEYISKTGTDSSKSPDKTLFSAKDAEEGHFSKICLALKEHHSSYVIYR